MDEDEGRCERGKRLLVESLESTIHYNLWLMPWRVHFNIYGFSDCLRCDRREARVLNVSLNQQAQEL
jgi:hypothetical protein